MENTPWIQGPEASLEDVLAARDNRSALQQRLLYLYRKPLICFTLNMAGPVKSFPLAKETFLQGKKEILSLLSANGFALPHYEESLTAAGSQGFFVVAAHALTLKKLLVQLEDSHPLGRLFDIDVLVLCTEPDAKDSGPAQQDPAGLPLSAHPFSRGWRKLSREEIQAPLRNCLLCPNPAFLCSRNRTHSVSQLFAKECQIMEEYFHPKWAAAIGSLFSKAMVYEVSTTPKPGLVDRWHTGAHKDMDISLFMDSIGALQPYFIKCARLGLDWDHRQDLSGLFSQLRPLGQRAEELMRQATGQVNTHKGLIFSGGILCAAAGYTYGHKASVLPKDISSVCREMLTGLSEDFKSISSRAPKSHGESLFIQYGLKGIRGEAMEGFPTVMDKGLPVFQACSARGFLPYRCGKIALLYLIAFSEDTNIIIRSSYQTWRTIQATLQRYLSRNSLDTLQEDKIIGRLDAWFVRDNISPGGSADLLALVYFLDFIDKTLLPLS